MASLKAPLEDMKKDNIIDWDLLSKYRISILVDNPLPDGSGRESYVGRIINHNKDFLMLQTKDNKRISAIIIKKKLILSIWIYKR